MEQQTKKTVEHNQSEDVQNQNEQGVRNGTTTNGRPEQSDFSGTDQATFQRISDELAAEAKIKADAEKQTGHSYHKKYTGVNARDDKSATVFARFDPKYTGVQPAEFYKCDDTEIDTYGYF